MIKQKVDQRYMVRGELGASIGRLRLDLDAFAVIGHVVILILFAIVTVGIGVIFFPYAAAKLILNSIVISDPFDRPTARLRCTMGWAEQTGHAVLWALLVGFTGGLMAPFYVFALAQFVFRRTELVPT